MEDPPERRKRPRPEPLTYGPSRFLALLMLCDWMAVGAKGPPPVDPARTLANYDLDAAYYLARLRKREDD